MSKDKDNYIDYTHKFFQKWLPLYDLFAASIFNVYSQTVKEVKVTKGLKVLDICTGTGEISIRLAKQGADVVAVDITEAMLNKAKSKAEKKTLKIDFRIMDARKLEFADSSFDVVVISNALHDMPRRVRLEVLKEAWRVAKNKLVITDYDLPKFLFPLWYWIIKLFETPYYRSYVKEGLDPLLVESSLPKGLNKKIFPGLFSVRILEKSI